MRQKVQGTSHLSADYFLYGPKEMYYYDRGDYGILQLPGLNIFIKSQEALDTLREVLKEKEEKLPETLESTSGSSTLVLTDDGAKIEDGE